MGLINNVLSILLPFTTRTLIIWRLGIEYVGLGGLFTSILQVLSLTELGFGSAISYLLYKPLAEHDVPKVNSLLTFFRKIYRLVGIAILVIAACLVPFLDKLVKKGVPTGISLYVLFGIYVFNTAISYFLFAYKRILLSANQRYDLEVNVNSVALLGQYVIQIIVLLLFRNYYLYIIVLPMMTIFGNLLAAYTVKKNYPEYHPEGEPAKTDLREIFQKTGGAFFDKVGSTVYLSADNIVISAVLGLEVLGIYTNYYYVIASLIAVYAVFHNSLRPTVGNMIATESKERVWDTFRKVNYGYMWTVIVCSACSMCLFQEFETIWAKAKNTLPSDLVILFVIYFFVGRSSAVIGVYREASGYLWEGKYISLIAAIVNLVVNIVLIHIIGLAGVLISSIVSCLLVTVPGYTYIVFRYLFDRAEWRRTYLFALLRQILKCVAVVVACGYLFQAISVSSWAGLVGKGILVFITSNLMLLFLAIPDRERKELQPVLLGKLKAFVKR